MPQLSPTELGVFGVLFIASLGLITTFMLKVMKNNKHSYPEIKSIPVLENRIGNVEKDVEELKDTVKDQGTTLRRIDRNTVRLATTLKVEDVEMD
jgi:hypothetical protein